MPENKSYLNLNKITPYKLAYNLSSYVWGLIIKWDYFNQRTVGIQLVRAMDSISANIAEGFGRYHKKDKINFYHYSLASTYEALDWLLKAKTRKLLNQKQYDLIFNQLINLPKEINSLIYFTQQKLKH
jgi:four helix bundle protein